MKCTMNTGEEEEAEKTREVAEIIKDLPKRKAPGTDRYTIEALKHLPHTLYNPFILTIRIFDFEIQVSNFLTLSEIRMERMNGL